MYNEYYVHIDMYIIYFVIFKYIKKIFVIVIKQKDIIKIHIIILV